MTLPSQWNPVSKGLHWLIAIFVLFAWGSVELHEFYQKGDPMREWWKTLHFSIGLTILLLVALRLYWRTTHPRPQMLGSSMERIVARITHVTFYALLLAMPILGLIMKQFAGSDTTIFWLFEIPGFVEKNTDIAKQLAYLHKELVWNTLLVLICLHVAAAVWHHLVNKDATLRRMLPSGRES
ncbi:cytochrome b [Microbulbifer flavimaris]|uniref:Cytochrome b n=1 Tax=Microbulbifer flavimaris TaxID=1781068 RepID=A0ABX4HW60_9GAMM|nr:MULTISPECIES: cytochrome b [Microbulbifer]KUJ81455.1 cytochrome B [Microbulbifer sp. ZGT114]PCO04365.1 cytochrome b [Microbulbifer flavimaris]